MVAQRIPLSRERVLGTAVTLADAHGTEALTMRRLAEELGVEAMSLYHHVPNKEALLDGVVDLVFAEIAAVVEPPLLVEPPVLVEPVETTTPENWKSLVRSRILASRSVLLRHKWAPALIESRANSGMPYTQYMDGIIGMLHAGGLDWDLIHHGMHALGSRAVGFVQEVGEPEGANIPSHEQLDQMEPLVPNIVAMLRVVVHDGRDLTLGWCDDQSEFEFGLDLILDGLELTAARRP
jgi:AcrR family transcriptional regulator